MKSVARVKEEAFRRRRREIVMNDLKFVVCKQDEILKFSSEGRNGIENECKIRRFEKMKKAIGDVSGGLNDSMDDLSDVIMFQSNQMRATNGLLESMQRHGIGNKGLASIQIHIDAVNLESRSLIKPQMWNGFNEMHDTFQ